MDHPVLMESKDNYFDHEYLLKSIWLGLVWLLAAVYPAILYAAATPRRDYYWDYWRWNWMTTGEWHAWQLVRIATGVEFGILSLLWLLSYIKKPDFQRIYYRAIAWIIPISWFFAFWALIAFIVGGTQRGGDLGWDIGYWLFYVIFEGAF